MRRQSHKRRGVFEIAYVTDPDYPEEWKSLDQLRQELPKSNWRHSHLLEYVDAAYEFGVTYPDGFLALSETEKAFMIARLRAKRTIQAYDDYQSSEAAKRSGGKA